MDINAINGFSSSSPVVQPLRGEVVQHAEGVAAGALVRAENAQQPSPPVEPARQPVEEAVSSIKEFAQSIQRNLNFALDDSSGRVVVKVTDAVSGDVIRQIPSEDALRLAESLEEVRSLLFKAQA
ncbi:flagellar protein FlaG [Pseudomonas sp. sp1636]|uniref:flagellar protein FlaG n=1 Tax=Pseudomonas sp. sp1636 TaxID=3036707 RepID=UPI0025A53BD1|nr:flagellar protein FlaG [Pseudomonas sp. sp1636]MDM8347718.1 flagellar protein FlaG [Pseudomonas sp. sp1636]